MGDDLPDEFDLVVVGTGFPESCVAAAASRIGKTVLHIDPNDYYGGAWASFSLDAFNTILQQDQSKSQLQNGCCTWHVVDSVAETIPAVEQPDAEPTWTLKSLLEKSRNFNLDLCPKILYSSGELVKLLVSSNICRYAEFRAVDKVCTRFCEEIINVPCSRSDVFNTKDLNIIEKRLLMKFLTICMTYGEDKVAEDMAIFPNKTFFEYLRAQRVTEKILKCVLNAIAMCTEETGFEEGMARTKRFLESLGRYGNTPFLFPMYGCGEIPQCFCRLCAVFGGIYCLKRNIEKITISGTTNEPYLNVEGKTIHARHLVLSHANIPTYLRDVQRCGPSEESLSRGIFIASSPLGADELNNGGGGVNLLRLVDGQREAILIQLSHYSGTCPKGTFIFHFTTIACCNNPALDLAPFIGQVFTHRSASPKILYSAYFTLVANLVPIIPSNITKHSTIFATAAPYYELDYNLSIKNARDIFGKIYPDAEFLPRAPDPEEIVIDGEDPRALSENSLPDDLRAQLNELEKTTQALAVSDEDEPQTQKMDAE